MKLRHLITRLSRLNLCKGTRETSALKAQFRAEDLELVAKKSHHLLQCQIFLLLEVGLYSILIIDF